MSGFDDNNPFGDPFSDPSIKQATGKSNQVEGSLDDYNPFASPAQTPAAAQPVRGASNPPRNSEPAILETGTANGSGGGSVRQPPAYTPSAAQTLTQAELQRRQEELDRRAAELAAREQALNSAGGGVIRENNWPPVPSICPFGPCFYQDINVEIPVEFQRIVRLAYYLWMYFVVVLLANLVGGIAKWAKEGEHGYFTFSIMCLLILTPASFMCWFRPLYKAFKTDSSFSFMVFFFVFFCQLVLSVFWAVGIPGSGACGLIVAIGSIGNGLLYPMLMFLVSVVLISYSGLSFLVLLKVHTIYRSTGASFNKAKTEFASAVASNPHVQQAAAGAARTAMTGAFAAATASNNSSTGVRY